MTSLSLSAAVEQYRIQEVPDAFDQILKQMNLPKALTQYQTERPRLRSQETIPLYHDYKHTQRVFVQAYEAGMWTHLNTDEAKEVAVAALFHDANHYNLAGIPDANNIRAALGTLDHALEEFAYGKHFSEANAQAVRLLIQATHFPHVDQRRVISSPINVIRDADIISSILIHDPEERLNSFLGLYNETIHAMTSAHRHVGALNKDFSVFIEKQQHFLLSYQFKSQWGRTKAFRLNLPALVRQLVHHLQFAVEEVEGGYRIARFPKKA